MKKTAVEKLNKVLDITGDLVKKQKSPGIDINTQDLTSEYEFSQNQYHNIIDKGNEAIGELIEIAKADESPRSFEVLGQLMNSLTTTTKELLLLQKTKKEIEKETKDPSTVNNSLFIGSTAELQELLTAKKK
jgi:hypothetical protein|tara:strand:- start:360 stop:755 length:396 start_codon:yes stop_codon:yes gene_type:complete